MIFPLKESEAAVSLFVIDESSMVGDRDNRGDVVQFGSGRLLKDVVTYARTSRAGRARGNLTKLLFIGDPAQLPPIQGGGFFTAQEPDAMLTEVHRQAQDDPIVWVSYVPLLPLALLLFSGLYLFVLPYVTRRRNARRA